MGLTDGNADPGAIPSEDEFRGPFQPDCCLGLLAVSEASVTIFYRPPQADSLWTQGFYHGSLVGKLNCDRAAESAYCGSKRL